MKKQLFTACILVAALVVSNPSYAQLGALTDKAKAPGSMYRN